MISRRGVVRLAGAVATSLGGALALPARAQGDGAADLAGLASLPATDAPIHLPGQGWFESVAPQGTPDGVMRLAGPDGRHWLRMGCEGVLRPGWFAASGDGADAARAIQRACDHAARFGPFVIDLGNARHHCTTQLTLDPTRAALRGAGAVLDFSNMSEPALHDPLATLRDILPADGWTRRGDTLARPDDGIATLTHALNLAEPGRYRVSLLVSALSGHADFPVLKLTVRGDGPHPLGGIAAISPGFHDFEVEGPQPGARLIIETNAAVTIDSLVIDHHGRREAVLVRSGETSPQYGHLWMEGVEVKGPGLGTRLHGMRFETMAEARSSRLALRDVTVQGFHTGMVFSHRAYLVRATGLRCACEAVGLHFLGGARDAGELISCYGGVIDGGRIAVLNNDAEVALFGTAVDFVDQVFVGSGRLTLQGCHLEVNRPKLADRPLIDLGQGNVAISGGSFGVTGAGFDAGNQCDHIFLLRSPMATASMREVASYNLRSRSGALAGGAGRLDTALLRGRRPRHMAPIVQFDAARNLLGAGPIDLRTSESATGPFQRFPSDVTSFRVSPMFRHIWLFGRAQPGGEVGVSFRLRSSTPGNVLARLQSFNGDARLPLGDAWPVTVDTDWTVFRNNTANTHPASTALGRMPDGFGEVALMLDLTEIEGTVEFADFFLCAV
ncbi:hypothetical protein [Oceaniglobus trochenteri]|uniref:hypothetical protein n=1 Tax=Oceaniglobus trochenteri TaxID=2763260 RepID=UPI001CFFF446|nr:hypothetical protein [Oceaniglobus trochenteri]